MQLIGFFCLAVALLITVGSGLACAWGLWTRREEPVRIAEYGQSGAMLLFGMACAILLRALVARDFSFQYVASYTDTFLPMFYAVTAFWAGQAGSFLFWAVCVAVMAGIFSQTKSYRDLTPQTKAWFWLLHAGVQAFFLLVLVGPTNPFLTLDPVPAEGTGLNPLLRNPGMIFHPPLLFFGYAGFTVPACLAVAVWITGDPKGWLSAGRNWSLVSWLFLTSGIVLGAWWSYMELGWGGYWAWDPVENASLIPWLAATAFLHTAVIQNRRNALHKTNVFFIVLTLLLCFFATYVVRSGVIDSLHAFGDGGVGGPLLTFMIAMLAIGAIGALQGKDKTARQLDEFLSRQGLLLVAAWLFLAVGVVVLLGTMWPVISNIWSPNPQGMDAGFYNRVCLPLFTLMALFLVFCPWLGWKGGLRNKKMFLAVAATLIPAAGFFWSLGVHDMLPLVAASSATSALAGIVALFATQPFMRRSRMMWGAYGVHVGLALMVLGIAFSGPYKQEIETVLAKGESVTLGAYEFTYTDHHEHADQSMARFEAYLDVSKDGKPFGQLRPERHQYRNWQQAFAEVSVIPSLGDEVYSTVLGHDKEGKASFKISVNPLVNWVWIGGTLMTLFPLLALGRRKQD
ncbi:heme lyase CcmF/NrfE family subunit [Desulfovibrio ferrophilus]|uniref:Cytochrome c assembly protein n=1 Tax=Desulfovibrio ferrophilus TaxID=241368 RepID=A0A2Z6AYN7_9BACT|nr:cytochrome c-type biogenesis CcmF C-terminal domain-containing protein [Desulfovibrio ferrophilus]BBD08372.1 cytochrome c assembly protein [Desulfovibrio ferrophilus]